ncbi:TPA: transposase [Methanosarcina acetivorans]|uniref:Transposase n=1 Tax=Methanosarcina acetivorans TaxID=2214 RepID=A0A832S7Z4_9EURY|nr:transposase [Methanosarcina acetivorans]
MYTFTVKYKKSWKIEEYHRGIKQFCGIEKCQARKEESQRAYIMFSLRAFLRTGITESQK